VNIILESTQKIVLGPKFQPLMRLI